MSAICWNCRGLGNPFTVNTLHKIVVEEASTLVFLMETKFDVSEIDWIKRKLEMQQGIVVPSVRRGGGGKQWCFMGFYGHPETRKREESWRLLEHLSRVNDLPWVCMGDFNEILHQREKVGGTSRLEGQIRGFCDAVNRSHLRDIGFEGSEFTWSRRLGPRGWVRERLYHALVSTNWVQVFPSVKLFHVATSASDHCILVLKNASNRSRKLRRSKMFGFESMWLQDEGCDMVVRDGGREDAFWVHNGLLITAWMNVECLCRGGTRSILDMWGGKL